MPWHCSSCAASCRKKPVPWLTCVRAYGARANMRVLLVHEYYQQPGGEDEVFKATCDLLRAHGHEVSTYERYNREIDDLSWRQKAALAAKTTWAWDTRREFQQLLRERHPQLVQFFNTFPLISPAVY